MTRIFPHLFAYKIEHIKNNLNNFINLGFSEQEIINLFHIIPDLDLITPEEIYTLLNILHQIGCTNPTIKHIINSNPFYLTRIDTDVINLINQLKIYGFSNLNHLFEINPYLLNKDVFEIKDFFNKINKTISQEQIIFLLENNPFLIDELN